MGMGVWVGGGYQGRVCKLNRVQHAWMDTGVG